MPAAEFPYAEFDLESTLYFPLSGNPVGFNHFAAAEWLLRRNPAYERVAFLLSNGRHPDPTKPDAEVDAATRLEILQAAIEAVADPERSLLARRAELAGQRLRVGPGTLLVSTHEFAQPRAVPTAETVALIRQAHPAGRVQWFAGADLVRRMADPAIFSPPDVAYLAQNCHYALLERGEAPVQAAAELQAAQGVTLSWRPYPLAEVPGWLSPALALSSTLIRHAAEAGDPLGAMLPANAAALIERQGLYVPGRPQVLLTDLDGHTLGGRSQLQCALERVHNDVAAEALRLSDLLLARRSAGRPHTLAVVETSTGGYLTTALAGRSGASRYFRQSRFAYDHRAKVALIGEGLADTPAVTEEMVVALAEGMRRAAGTDVAIAESGMAGPPDGRRRSLKSGLCWIAVVTPEGTRTEEVELNPYLTRREHALAFAARALALARRALEGAEG